MRKRRRVGEAWRAFGVALGVQLLPWQIDYLMRVYGEAVPGKTSGRGKR